MATDIIARGLASNIEPSQINTINEPTNGEVLVYEDGEFSYAENGAGGSDNKDVKVSSNDTTAGFLESKIDGTTDNIEVTVENEGGNENLKVDVGSNIPKLDEGNAFGSTDDTSFVGNVGVGIDSPSEKLEVDGNIKASGNIEGEKCGVFAYLSAPATTTITTAGTYYPIAGTFSNDPIEQFGAGTVITPSIKYTGTKTRYFEIDWHASIEANANNTEVRIGTKKNGTLCQYGVMTAFCKNLGEIYNASGTCVYELAEDDEVQLVVTSDGSGDEITFDNFTTTIRPFYW